jgi:N-acetylglucosaminyl-diphospho-decaprenol L-rhamnosyltransferase
MESHLIQQITAISVTFNSLHCVSSLERSLSSFSNKIIVDNGSDDATADLIARCMPEAKLIRSLVNVGFGAANNRALEITTTPYALLINPDCIVESEFLVEIVKAMMAFPDAAIIAPALFRGNGTREVSYRWPGKLWKSSGPEAIGPCCVGFVSGAAMLLNMEVMREVGFFDETFFLYYEDEDLCLRVFEKRKQIVIVPSVQLTHLSRGSVKGRHPWRSEFLRGFHHAQSKLVFEHKHTGLNSARRLRWKTLGLAVLTLVPRLMLFQPKYMARLLGRIVGLCRPYPRANA